MPYFRAKRKSTNLVDWYSAAFQLILAVDKWPKSGSRLLSHLTLFVCWQRLEVEKRKTSPSFHAFLISVFYASAKRIKGVAFSPECSLMCAVKIQTTILNGAEEKVMADVCGHPESE